MSTESELIALGDRLFNKRGNLLTFWQDIMDNFNPVASDYTSTRTLGDDYASDLMTSYPLIVGRELSDTFSSMLRPSDKEWFFMESEGVKDWEGKAWLEDRTKVMRRAMYDRRTQFVSAAKEGDRDFALTGQTVISIELRRPELALLYRAWHLRDVAWSDDIAGMAECVHAKMRRSAYDLKRQFGEEKLHQNVRDCLAEGKNPYQEFSVRWIVIPTDMYHGETKFRTPLVSIYLDVDNEHIIEITGERANPFVIPRWQRIKGTQYAVSPATVCALPEARLLQAMTYTLLEAGEKGTSPPMLAVGEAIRGDIDIKAGGITYVSSEYDERTGEVLRPLTQDKSGIPFGLEQQQRSEILLRQAFYLDKLDLPQRGPEMTAYEVGQRVQAFIRGALPLFEPMEMEYNGGLCERTFDIMAWNGGFGPPDTWPDTVRAAEIHWRFVSPLRDAIDKQKGQTFAEASALVSQAVALDPGAGSVVNASEALRDALEGIGVPTVWTRPRKEVQEIAEEQAEMAQQQQMLESMTQASQIASNLSGAAA